MSQGAYSFERFAARRVYFDYDFLAGSGDIVYSANTSGQFNVWRQAAPRGREFGPARQLTAFVDWSVRNVTASPDGRTLIVFADQDGDENYQVFKVDAEKGWQAPIVLKSGVRHESGIRGLSPDGKSLCYSSNERNPRDMDIVVTSLATGRSKTLAQGDAYRAFGHWAPSGRQATIIDLHSNEDQDAYVVDVRSGRQVHVTPHEGDEINIPGPWDPSGRGFYLLTDRGREKVGLDFLQLGSGGKRTRLETGKGEVGDAKLRPDGGTLAWAENVDGYSFIRLRDLRSGKDVASFAAEGALLPGALDNSNLLKFSPDGRRLGFIVSRPRQPPEIYVMELPSAKTTRYTDGFVGNIPASKMVEPSLVALPSFDRRIPAFLYKPRLPAGGRAPVVLAIHGGPQAQERPAYLYAGLYQFLLSRGIGVLAPNIRGSTGYGKSYMKLINHDWGGGELKDIEAAWRYLLGLGWVDQKRIAVFGGSFGGFATLEAVTRIPEAWRAAVDIFGPSNLVTFARAVPPHWRRMMDKWLGNPDTEREFLESRSPITYVEKVACPMLIIQGAKDPRVVKPESDQFVEKLRALGRQVDYIVLPDEGHGFTKQKNEFAVYKKVTEFLTEQLA
jgi:dipeptidyl aminopeptidase/acylaminoacyl peptidase